MTAPVKPTTLRQRAYRERKAALKLAEVRGIFAPPTLHAQIKRLANGATQACSGSKSKCVGVLIAEPDGYPLIDLSASLMSRIERIAFLEHLAAHVTSSIAQLEHDRL
jgi:hypothetical protein